MAEHGKIDTNDVSVLVEESSSPRYVIEGLATSMGRYDKPLFEGTEFIYPSRRMNKTGNLTLSTTFKDVQNWTADSGSTVTNHGLVAPITGQGRIRARLKLSAFKTKIVVQMLINGIVIHQDSVSGTTVDINRSYYLKANDLITIRARYEASNYWFWETPSMTVLAEGTFVALEDFPDQKIDFERDMVYGSEIGFWGDSWGQYVTPTYLKRGMPFATNIRINAIAGTGWADTTSVLSRGSVSGPILAQSRIPIPVISGSKVNFSGTFRVRRTGTNEQTEAGSNTAVSVRFSLWGIGITTDEYGVESIRPEELMMRMFTLQPSGSEDESMMEFVIAPDSITDATVQSWMTGMYFTVSLVHDGDGAYGAGTFTSKVSQANNEQKPPIAASEMRYFGWSATNPLDIKIELPPGTQEVTVHPLSLTGVAFKNRQFFDGLDGDAEMVFFGMPGSSNTVSVYNHDGTTRGSLIGTYTANDMERKVVNFTAQTSRIEIVGTDYFIESVMNAEIRELYRVRTPISDTTYVKINEDLTKISIVSEEDGVGSVTLDFSSEQLDPVTSNVLSMGKRIRILARHYGAGNKSRPAGWVGEPLWDEIFEGVIKKNLTTYDYKDEPIEQITAYNVGDKLDRMQTGVAFDKFNKYGGFLTSLGATVFCNGRTWFGPVSDPPYKYLLNPAAHGDFSLKEGFTMTRNTNKEYFFVNAKDQLVFTNTIESSGVKFSDQPGGGNLSYGKINRKADNQTVINQVVTNEQLLDQQDYSERSLSADRPPEDLRYPETKTQTGTFTNADSANDIGVLSKSFAVVRTFDGLDKLYAGEIGGGFPDWAAGILSNHAEMRTQIRDFNVPIKNSEDIYWISRLDLMKSAIIVHKGEEMTTPVREINHVITPGKWTCKVGFESKGNRTFW